VETGNPYTTGGPVSPQDKAKIYIHRQADDELLQNCLQGEYSVVLTARQMGKTSLLDHTIVELEKYGVTSARIDLQGIGTGNITADEWYQSLLSILVSSFDLDTNVEQWWKRNTGLTLNLRFRNFLTDIVLKSTPRRMVIFIDEIEIITRLDEAVSDSFFAVIRSLYTARGTEPDLQRISFVLLGMTQISDLIRQPDITTFNIGKRIELENFGIEEILPLVQTIPSNVDEKELSDWILGWTGGQPYLTQLICERLNQLPESVDQQHIVDQLVETLILENDSDLYGMHIVTIVKNIASKPFSNVLLGVYALIVNGELVLNLDESNAVRHLKLFGLVTFENSVLKIANLIYQRIFDIYWIERQLKSLRVPSHLDQVMSDARKHLSDVSPMATSGRGSAMVESSELLPEHQRNRLTTESLSARESKLENESKALSPEVSRRSNEERNIASQGENSLKSKSKSAISRIKTWLRKDPGLQTALVINGSLVTAAVLIWGLYANSFFSLAVSGSFLLLALVILGMIVTIRSDRSLVEERLRHFLNDKKQEPEVKDQAAVALERLNRRLTSYSIGDRIAQELARADLQLKVGEYYALIFLSTVCMFIISWLLWFNAATAIIGGVIGFLVPRFYVRWQQELRLKTFDQQLTNALNLMVNSLRAGYSTMQTMDVVSREMAAPISDEFRRVVQEMKLGIPMGIALENLLRRVPLADLDYVVTTINVQRETGGNLTEILENIRARLWENKRLTVEEQKLSLLSFDFFYCTTVIAILVQNIVFPNNFDLVFSNDVLQNAAFFLLIVWSLILILVSFIQSRQEELSILKQKQQEYQLIVNVLLLTLSFLAGVPELLCLWLILMFLARWQVGLILAAFVWFMTTLVYLASTDFLSFTLDPERIQTYLLVLENIIVAVSNRGSDSATPISQPITISLPIILIPLIVITLLVAIAIVMVSMRRDGQEEQNGPLQARLAEFIQRGDATSIEEIELSQPFIERTIVPLLERLSDFFVRFSPQKTIQDLDRDLEMAGNPWPVSAPTFLALRFILAIVLGGFMMSVILVSPQSDVSSNFIYVLGSAFSGYYLPALMLRSRIARRQKEIYHAMPDALDLFAICVEAGLGFEAAMLKISEKWEYDLSLEFARTVREIQLGKTRGEALRDMSSRIGLPEFTYFIAGIMQSESSGISLARALRVQSNELFMERREKILQELVRLELFSKTLLSILFGLVFVLWFSLPIVAQLPIFH
jgi:tight adherence protein C